MNGSLGHLSSLSYMVSTVILAVQLPHHRGTSQCLCAWDMVMFILSARLWLHGSLERT